MSDIMNASVLAGAVVRCAVRDYKILLRHCHADEDFRYSAYRRVCELEEFFRSSWCDMLCELCGYGSGTRLMRLCQQEAMQRRTHPKHKEETE